MSLSGLHFMAQYDRFKKYFIKITLIYRYYCMDDSISYIISFAWNLDHMNVVDFKRCVQQFGHSRRRAVHVSCRVKN